MPIILDDTHITIPFPRPTQNTHRGYLYKAPETKPTSIRLTEEDRKTVDKAARALGMSFGEFTKWCAFYCAIEVNNEITRRSFKDKAEVDTSEYK